MPGLSDDQREQFERNGYLLIEGLIDCAGILDPLVAEYTEALDVLATELHRAGRISETFSKLPFSDRFIRVEQETNETNAQFFDFSLPQGGIAHDTPMWLGKAVFEALVHPPLLDVVESVIGSEIYSNPVQHIRIKSPERLGAKDPMTGAPKMGATNWHQDNGVVLPIADDTDMLTVWFSLDDAAIEHGCLQVLPGSHEAGLFTHCPAGPGGLEIPAHVASRKGAVAVPTRRGDALLLHKRTVHASLSNTSDRLRWSLDLRYNPIGQETGRGVFPGFVARSRSDPSSEMRSPEVWGLSWHRARAQLADATHGSPFHRWSADAPACA